MSKSTITHATTRGKSGLQHPPTTRSAGSGKAATRKRTAAPQTRRTELAAEERQQLIAQAAYFIAERRGFVPGNELDDWLQAEAEVDVRIKGAMQ